MVFRKYFSVRGCLIFLLLVIFMAGNSACVSQNKMSSPIKNSKKENMEEYGKGDNIVLNFYQKWISPVRGEDACPMYPSCSQYSKKSFEIFSPLKAYFLSCERVIRCGHELTLYPQTIKGGKLKWYDPVPEK
jgi:uncharacterized protein